MKKERNRILAAIFAIFLGSFGVHKFYLGQTFLGILYVLFMWTGIPYILGIIEGILLMLMDEEKFHKKYNTGRYARRRERRRYKRRHKYQRQYNGGEYDDNDYDYSLEDEEYTDRRKSWRYEYEFGKPRGRKSKERTRASRSKKVNNPYRAKVAELYNEFDYEEAIVTGQKSLRLQPQDPEMHFQLACLYSLLKSKKSAFFHLQKSFEQGYNDYSSVDTNEDLRFLRLQPEFQDFVNSGYKISAKKPKDLEDVLGKIEKLGTLLEKGLLTEEEFKRQKDKLLGETY